MKAKQARPRAADSKQAVQAAGAQGDESTYQEVLDESLGETFPASDPIASSAAAHADQPTSSGKDRTDWTLDPAKADDSATQVTDSAERDPAKARAGNTDPVDFPTSAHHPSREERIREAAYRHFEQRGEQPGSAEADWLRAEQDIDGSIPG